MAPTRPDSIELVEYTQPLQNTSTSATANGRGLAFGPTATAHPSPSSNTDRFAPAANSTALALAGLGLELDEAAHEKNFDSAGESTQHRSSGGPFRFTRLRFWKEALKRRAEVALVSRTDNHTGTDTGTGTATPAKMKFSHSVQFNAVPDWSSNYIAYSNLKKL